MKQKGSNSTNVQIGHGGSGNTYFIESNQLKPNHIQLTIDEDSTQTYKRSKLENDSKAGLLKLVGSILFSGIGLVSDSIGISEYLGFSLWSVTFFIGSIVGVILMIPHFRSSQLLAVLKRSGGKPVYSGNNEIVEEANKGTVTTYGRSAPCIYPNCDGSVILHDAPEREKERLRKEYVGICSRAGKDHSYVIDNIWNAYPREFDWRKPVKEVPNSLGWAPHL